MMMMEGVTGVGDESMMSDIGMRREVGLSRAELT